MVTASDDLASRLAAVLPAGHSFGVYHLSTPPTRTDALFHAPPGSRPDRTYLENHFVAVTIAPDAEPAAEKDDEVIVFALELLLFTTAFATTLFVAKADSSGYLHRLALPPGTLGAASPIRAVTTAFVSFLLDQRRRPDVPCVVSLFARAQSQYLFPGSVDNAGKHVLDDRGLVKWWCKVLDPLLGVDEDSGQGGEAGRARAYLVVPGLDAYETRAFLPRRGGATPSPRWTLGDPLVAISHYTRDGARVPPRCLIPRYPDDPKARYVDELDDEAERGREKGDQKYQTPAWDGQWRGVRSLDQFWEMMAFRQECSSGRLTGFLWVVWGAEDRAGATATGPAQQAQQAPRREAAPAKRRRKVLRGYIVSRRPRPKTQQRTALARRPATTPYYVWPAAGRGRLLVDTADYRRINELLLQLDFSTWAKAAASTRRWVREAGVGSGNWRMRVAGEKVASVAAAPVAAAATDLGHLIKRKRAPSAADAAETPANSTTAGVNVLSAGLVRKKKKPVT